MSVMVTMRVAGEAAKLEAVAAKSGDVFQAVSARAKEHEVISHRFYASDTEIMVVDEWPSGEAFQAFFDASPEIPTLMQEAGITTRPVVTVWRKLDLGDEIG